VRVIPYLGRKLNARAEAWVYRNLMRSDGPWYSVMQGGIVICHAREVALEGVRFVVRPAGRRRAIETGVKNVHAFVVGRVIPRRPTWEEHGEAVVGRYKPRLCDAFEMVEPDNGAWHAVASARAAYLGPDGLRVYGGRP
jgi:hypothetical protein